MRERHNAGAGAVQSQTAARTAEQGLDAPSLVEAAARRVVPGDLALLLAEQVAARVAETVSAPPRLALSVSEACAALGVGWDFWKAHIAPEMRLVRRGSRRLVPVAELERWLQENAERPLDTGKRSPTGRKSPANEMLRATRAPARGPR